MRDVQLPLTWPFVGRGDELDQIDGLRRAGAHAVVISGPPGVGKTRLAREAAARAADDGYGVSWAYGTEAARDLPLGAFLHLVPDGPPARGEALLGAIVDGLRERLDTPHVVLVVDDGHLLDSASATLVHRLAQTERAFAIVTAREGEAVPDAIRLLWRDDTGRRVELGAFDRRATAELSEAMIGGRIDAATLETLWNNTRGNALFVRELIADGVREGALQRDGDTWRWRGDPFVPASVREIVETRVEQLDAAHRAALEQLAVCEPIGLPVFQQLADPETIQALERAGFAELSIADGRTSIRTSHPLYGDALRAAVPASRARVIRAAYADALAATGARRAEDVLMLGKLRLATGDDRDPDLLVRAARQAWYLGHVALVEALATAASRRQPNPEAEYLLGEAEADRGRFDAALERWEPLGAIDGDEELVLEIAKARASVLANVFNRTDEALAILDEASTKVSSEHAHAILDAVRANVDWRVTVTEPPAAADDEATVWMWMANSRARLMAGGFDDVADDPTPVDELARRIAPWPLLIFVRITRFFALVCGTRFDDAEALCRDGLTEAVGNERRAIHAYWMEGLGLVELTRGRPHDAISHLRDAVAELRECNPGALRNALHELALACAEAGDTSAACAALEEAEQAQDSVVGPFVTEGRVRAAIEAARGRNSAAVSAALEDAKGAEQRGEALYELFARFDAARYGAPPANADRLRDVASPMQGPLPSLFAGFADALARADYEALAAVGTAFGELRCALYAAEAVTAAARIAADAALPIAVVLREQAEHFAAAAGNPPTPLLTAGTFASPLTAREREVAGLVAQGRTDRQVAEELGLSVRTVNAHLRSVYFKLKVSGREELARALGRPPI